jgi:cytochrome P450
METRPCVNIHDPTFDSPSPGARKYFQTKPQHALLTNTSTTLTSMSSSSVFFQISSGAECAANVPQILSTGKIGWLPSQKPTEFQFEFEAGDPNRGCEMLNASDVDLFDHRQTQNLWDTTKRWRQESPIVRFGQGYCYVAKWADCWTVLRDPQTFANGDGFKAVVMPEEERMLGEMDPPRHPRLRRIMRQSFDRTAVEAERPFARQAAQKLIDDWSTETSAELVSQFTDPVTNLVSFHLLGFPLEDSEQIVRWVRDLLHSDWPAFNRTERGEGLAGAFPEFTHYLDRLVESRRGPDAPDDLVARLVRSRLDGKPLTATVLRSLTAHVVLGGISTTTNLLGSMLLRILRDPSLHSRLRAAPKLIPAAVEESLRLDPPVLFVMRECRRTCQIGQAEIEEGQKVLVGIASANRDEDVFGDPDTYRLDRGLPRHISFSGGAHHCIGAGLARLVACEAISAFVEHFDPNQISLARNFEFEGVPVFLEYGPKQLSVEFERFQP